MHSMWASYIHYHRFFSSTVIPSCTEENKIKSVLKQTFFYFLKLPRNLQISNHRAAIYFLFFRWLFTLDLLLLHFIETQPFPGCHNQTSFLFVTHFLDMIKPSHTICHGFDLSHNAISQSCSCLPDVKGASPQRLLGPGEPSCCLFWGLAKGLMLT